MDAFSAGSRPPATMPLTEHQRQTGILPSALDWFGSTGGRCLLADEARAMQRVLAACPALPRAWIGVPGAPPPSIGGRGLLLHREGGRLAGSIRCGLPLPLASETLGALLLQHVLDDAIEPAPLLDECARVLAPGGTLWLATLNPWTPYRLRWARTGLAARDPGHWQAALRRVGFSGDAISLQWVGPHWREAPGGAGVGAPDRLRAGIALTVSKRVRAVVPPARLRALRWQAGRSGTARP
jgi:SAM-dependent methyltransferase